ncbi:hypothetical protein LBMAG41_28710 [Cyanobium sp.]|jgi:hypothetical protein|nr:hypothetical protein LBMAG41_28710 [Cyanobium sp.]
MGQVNVRNNVTADVTVKIKGPDTPETSGKCHARQSVAFDLDKMVGWKAGDQISISVHANGGVTRHNNAGQYQPGREYRYSIDGTLTAFAINGPK